MRSKATKSKRPLKNKVTVHLSIKGVKPAATFRIELMVRARRMLKALGVEAPELSVLLCGDPFIQGLNRSYRGKDKPTDVLAFPMDTGVQAGASLLLGDVVISLPTARRQAYARGHALMEEVTFLLAHGLLHLLGMDHRDPREEKAMTAYTHMLWAAARGLRHSVDKPVTGN